MFIPFLGQFSELIIQIGGPPAQQVANAHLVFNLITALVLLIFY